MENLGELLRQQRENKHLSVEEVATQTRIAVRFIQLIEENRFDLLPNVVSAKGFLRSYARCLGLDETEILSRFPETVRPPEPSSAPSPKAVEEKVPPYIQRKQPDRLPFPLWATFSVAVVIALFIVLAFIMPRAPETASTPSVPEAEPQMEPGPIDSSPIPDPSPVEQNQTASPSPPTATPVPSVLPTSPSARVLIVEATESSWVHVAIDGKETKEALLQPGEKVRWEAKQKFVLTVGNAGGIRAFFDGEDLGVLGPRGRVAKREIP